MAKLNRLELTTGYLTDALDLGGLPGRQVSLRVGEARPLDGLLVIDPNACGLDNFGDPTFCTLIATFPRRVTLRLLEDRRGDQLFALESPDSEGPALRLALLQRDSAEGEIVARLLVLGDDGNIQRILPLEPPRGARTP